LASGIALYELGLHSRPTYVTNDNYYDRNRSCNINEKKMQIKRASAYECGIYFYISELFNMSEITLKLLQIKPNQIDLFPSQYSSV